MGLKQAHLICPLLLLASACLAPTTASADWPAQGRFVLLTGDSFNGTSSVWIENLPSGDLLVRGVGVGGNSNGYVVQRISPYGVIAPGWPARGAAIGAFGKSIREWEVGFAVDDAGFAWMQAVGLSNVMAANRVDTAGVYAGAPWPLTTLVNTAATPSAFAQAPDGFYAYFNNRLQRMTRSGAISPGWPATGVSTISSVLDVAALADGSGGVVIMAPQSTAAAAQRFDANGLRHAGWPAAGLALSTTAETPDSYDMPSLPNLRPSDSSHCFAVWSGPGNSAIKHILVQRIALDGAIDPAWPSGAFEAVSPDSVTGVSTLPDRSGGLYVLWYAHGLPRATHVLADGTFAPGTDAAGTSLVPAGASYLPPLRLSFPTVLPYVPADVTADGRLVFAWDDSAIANSIRVRWLLPDLTADPTEPSGGRLIQPNDRKTYVRAVHTAPDGGAYIAWESAGTDPTPFADNGEVWMTRLLPSSLVGVAPPSRRPSGLALSTPRPNPARGTVALDVTLPDDSPARVELLDVAGRVVRTELVQGAGAHAIAFGGLSTLEPGLYFVRARARAGSAATRVSVSR